MRNKILSKKLQYIHDLFSITDAEVVATHQFIKDDISLMQLNLIEGQILQLLIKMNNIKSIIEIGTFVGSSAMCMAKALPENGHIYTIEKNTINAELAEDNFKKYNLSHKITVINDIGILALQKLTNTSPFDMIFIDANKSGYCDYLDWAESNIKKNGLIVADNTLLFGNVYSNNNTIKKVSKTTIHKMLSFNKRLSDKDKYLTTLLPTEEGMTIALKLF
ncbi:MULTISPECIES: O-methyltransferase [Ehrlichia]|uniref:O-methyltransferase family protein n=1 Tax=Ehrlichia cf. muris str. EmCRT TaxID=1359167 RepID=A0A0F3NDZ4_9RICK|nr:MULTISPECIES: O-methyltransferase [Ehrlichia]KJV65937.1 O-methyltransferase family protein [Ehrlichia cf. muris str. EmCRT]OUC04826.1 methyltransferase [Ehrlichia sp. Wisconsin_h]